MANRTVSDAIAIHGTNPQYLIEKIMRTRIYESLYWKEYCFGLTAETLIDRAIELTSFGGEYGNQKPTEFLCLTLKLLQLQPNKDIVMEFIKNEEYKYLRVLGAFYLRLVGNPLEIYQTLEPLLNDYRKLRKRTNEGDFEVVCVDEFIDELLREERVCDTILPRISKRHVLEENGELPPRESVLQDLADEEEKSPDTKDEERDEEREEEQKEEREEDQGKEREEQQKEERVQEGEEEEEEGEVKSRSSKSRERSKRDRSSSRSRNRRSKSNGRRNRSYSRSRSPLPRKSRSRSRSRSPRRRGGDWRADRYVPSSSSRSSRRRRRISYSRSRSRSRSRSYDRYEPSYRRGKSFSSSSYRPSRHRSYSRSRSR